MKLSILSYQKRECLIFIGRIVQRILQKVMQQICYYVIHATAVYQPLDFSSLQNQAASLPECE